MKSFDVISPVDDSVYLTRNFTSEKKIAHAITNSRIAQKEWMKRFVNERATICLAAVDYLLSEIEDASNEITWQMGRPIQYSMGELIGFAERARYMISIAEEKLSRISIDSPEGVTRYIQREPLGVVLSITPWNYPYLTAVNSIIPALMAGNSVILKPSNQTPLVAERLANAFANANLPDNVFQYLFLDHSQTDLIIKHEDIDYVAFTGSVSGGLSVQKSSAKRFIGLGLELGGKDPAYVREDADLSHSAANLVDGVFFNSGQSCCGIERIYVHKSQYESFVSQFIELTNKFCLGDPLQMGTTLGPMVRKSAADRVRKQIDEAITEGATPCIDKTLFKMDTDNTAYLAPQVLLNVDHTMNIMCEESFGPVIGIMPVDNDEHAIQLMNESEYGLTASVWTNDQAAAIQMGEKINTGTWFMNRCDYLDPALAWVGIKNSGRGSTLSEIGYENLTRPKSFYLKTL